MAHVPERLEEYVCVNCSVTHAGTPIHLDGGEHSFEPPASCGACGGSEFVPASEWIHHHE